MTLLLIHDAPVRAAELRTRLESAVEGLPPEAAEPLLDRIVIEGTRVPRLVLTGHHSSGKSMLIKALTDGEAQVVIDADVATDKVTEYTWDGAVVFVDTPGVHAGIETHDELALDALMAADLVLFVITPDLFDDSSAQHLQYVADALGKREQLMVLVNKAQTMGADPGLRQRELSNVLGDGKIPPLLECDAKQYVRSLTEQDDEIAEHLRATSGIDALRGQINKFSDDRGELAMMRRPFQLIRSIAAEAETSLVANVQEKAVLTWLSRVRNALSQAEQSLATDLRSERADFLRVVLLEAEEFADAVEAIDEVDESAFKQQFDDATAATVDRLNIRSNNAAERMQEAVETSFRRLSGEIREIEDGPQAALIRTMGDSSREAAPPGGSRWDLRAKRRRSQSSVNVSENMRQAKQLLNQLETFWGAGGGTWASRGTAGHKITKNVGSVLGKKWRPWQSVRLANRVGKALKLGGVALQIGITAYSVYAEEQAALKVERAEAARRRGIVNFVMSEAETHIDDVIRSIHTIADAPFQDAYHQIDNQWDRLLDDKQDRAALRDELRTIQRECSRMTATMGRESARREIGILPDHVVP